MSDIAAHLGVSRLTVSAVLNGREQEVGVGEETARRVREASEKLGYHRNHLALAMKTGRNPVIGCLVGDLKSEWSSRTLSGMLRQLHEKGYLSKIEEVEGPEAELAALQRFVQQRIAGIFCVNFNPEEAFIRTLEETAKRYEMPIVCSLSRKEISGGWVDSDDYHGVKLAVDHLYELGHRRIAFFGGVEWDHTRMTAFCEAAQAHGLPLPASFVVHTGWHLSVAESEALSLTGLPKSSRPTAFVCASDKIAAIVLRTAHRQGLSVPGDVSVVGFSNSDICELTDPELTSVAQPFEDVGRKCGLMLTEMIGSQRRKQGEANPIEYVSTRLVVRKSTGPSPGRRK